MEPSGRLSKISESIDDIIRETKDYTHYSKMVVMTREGGRWEVGDSTMMMFRWRKSCNVFSLQLACSLQAFSAKSEETWRVNN